MCNRYAASLRKLGRFFEVFGYEEFSETRIRHFDGRVKEDLYPKYEALVLWPGDGRADLCTMRWGFPPPPASKAPVTNVRNTASSFWRPWLKPEHRCLVPATSFAEFSPVAPRGNRWFGLANGDPFFFAGICRPYDWRAPPGELGHNPDAMAFAFLTTEPNAIVKPFHEKAMPAIITNADDADAWLNAPAEIALNLQRPLPDDELTLLDALR